MLLNTSFKIAICLCLRWWGNHP